jgi:hypothetical protein
LKDQFPVVVCDTFCQVDIRILALSLGVAQDCPKDRESVVSLQVETDVRGTFAEVLALPIEVA